MEIELINGFFNVYKEKALSHRYITNGHIVPLLKKFSSNFKIKTIGRSVLNEPIYALEVGHGKKRLLIWSQMHGNESSTTKAIFDLFNTLMSNEKVVQNILSVCTLCVIPILNPDGAAAYTRVNANNIDLNRDAQRLTQPESLVLKSVFETFKPHFCYNLHGQRTIFSAGHTNKPATVSFLAPAQDSKCTVTSNRKIAMEIIVSMNTMLQKEIPGQVGVYDDAFNLNCVGDAFQSKNIPTILFEAGHYKNDYARDVTRKYIYIALFSSLLYISNNNPDGSIHRPYFDIPENEKLFFDIVIRNGRLNKDGIKADIGIMYQERLVDNKVLFIPKIEKIEDLSKFYGHKEYCANGSLVLAENNKVLEVNDENDFVIINNEKIALLMK
ncbi:M14 family zinc carboxypeptidase [Aestuariivivens sp. NBU2969]|uniref:M14 family zinc carboxypeptidase n=1 Tax=Aestuariivivens sp. NBU2969 TaxID=2873267 RepID=UPI001CC1B2A4|nr:M14 family zinc carboxypeptidase [Aestuariivivens sp. NBU2969]